MALLVLAAAGSQAREVTRLSTTGMLNDGSGVLPFVSGLILVGAACAVLAGLVMLLARRRRRDDEFVVVLEPTGTRWQRTVALIAALVLAALLVTAVLGIVHVGQPGRRAASHPAPVVPAAPHLPAGATPLSGGTVTLALLAAAGGLIVATIAAAGLLRRRGAAASAAPENMPVPLATAVAAASSALSTATGPREAIISCYAAMEESLAAAGSPRLAADTPEELLNRAESAGAIHTPAAARLTALFREARFSPHVLGEAQRDAAQDALDDIAQDLAANR